MVKQFGLLEKAKLKTVYICLDPIYLNKAIKRCHHRTSTLEEITQYFTVSKHFSKLDAKNGYWSMKLDAQLQRLTTFNLPFGRFFFQHMPVRLVVSQDVFQHMPVRLVVSQDVFQHMPIRLVVSQDVFQHMPVRLVVSQDVFQHMPVGLVVSQDVFQHVPVGLVVSQDVF